MLQIVFIDTDQYQFDAEFRSLATTILNSANQNVRQHLPSLAKHLTFTIYPTTKVIPETGETAGTQNPNLIQWSVNPWDDRGVEGITQAELSHTFFHEAHHAVRLQTIGWYGSIMADAIFEGLATVFERDIANATTSWGNYDTNVIKAWTSELLSLNDQTTNRPNWFFDHPDGRRWIAYKVGTYIVDQAINSHPQESSATLVDRPASEILKLAGLNAN